VTFQEVFGILISITALSSYINYKFIKLPKSIGITLVTLFLSVLILLGGRLGLEIDNFARSLLHGISFNETFLHGMLSFLLFAGSLHINVVELSKYKVLVGFLATVSVIISTLLIGYATYVLTQCLGVDLPIYYCFVFGALISPTDPIAVLGVLKRVKAPKSLEMKIAGEALFNDGMGIVLFFVAIGLATGTQEHTSAQAVTLYFIQQGLGGILVGIMMGWMAAKLIKSIDDYEVAIIITLAIVTAGYTFAHSIVHVSGPVCMAVSGLVIGNSLKNGSMTQATMIRLDGFWELLDEVLNTVLFVLIGLEFLQITFDLDNALISIGAIGICIAARWISIAIPVACLTKFKKFNTDVLMIMTWGGLRGGISIALALSVVEPFHSLIVTITYAVVLFSIMVQGLTIGNLIKRLSYIKRYNKIEYVLPDSE
jgi:monovalent cation:H+ antiporter, CPA1 family